MAKTVYDVLSAKYQDEINLRVQALIQGSAKDFADYRKLCGEIQGLSIAQREVHDLAKRQLEQEDD